ncbi:bisanhydrobacterioruberin hydratase [Halarchaeum sp. P4]|uniref:bisanhydrobacterioruberin hydratase n=1 Tax=Halarchaeum sp. P4 TaxID=3421639 RepID=UPI003EBCC58C
MRERRLARHLPARGAVERRLEAFVEANRLTLAVVAPVMGALSLLAGAYGFLPPEIAFSPVALVAGTLMLRLPLVAGLAPLLDRRAVGALAGLCAYSYGIEYVGTTTGWPYGAFAYGVELGPMVAGVPLALPLFFVPLVVNAFLLTVLVLGDAAADWRLRVPAVVLVVVGIDAVLDPGAVALGFWAYGGGGVYYGVPLSNYAGWVLSATVAALALEAAFDVAPLRRRLETCAFVLDDLVSFVLLWGLVNLAFANWLPVLGALLLVAALWRAERFDVALRRPVRGRSWR